MYAFWFLITTLYLVTEVVPKSCLEVKLILERDCQASDQQNYVECVRTRMKRHSSDCKYDDQCFDCDCDFCQYSQCGGQCSDCCNLCCSNFVQCHTTHCCHKQCHGECRTYNCRSSCRKFCYESIVREEPEKIIDREVIEKIIDKTPFLNGGTRNLQSNTSNINAHNITTVINLKNVINNTNLIDVPINLNYTNKNNISLTESGYGTQSGPVSGRLTGDSCCIVIGPRQCRQISAYPYVQCFHYRSKQCGSYCTANIIHAENVQVCDKFNALGQPICEQQTAYIPQPEPKCAYTNMWPYVTCRVQPPAPCEGCYGHYFNQQVEEFKSCPPQCYNDFGAGPLYRQGPFYQPAYSHMPPCYFLPQGCGGPGPGFGAMGGLGNVGGVGGFGMMPGFSPGYGGGFGYGAQLPMSQPFVPPQQVQFNPEIVGDPINTNTNNEILLNSSDLLNRMVIKEYQSDDNGSLVSLYDLPDQAVKIDVQVIDPNETKYFQLPRKNLRKRTNEIKEAEVVIV